MKTTLIGLILIVSLLSIATAQDSSCEDANLVYDAESSSCRAGATVTFDIRYPEWLFDYPDSADVIMGHFSQERAAYLDAIFYGKVDYGFLFETRYTAFTHNDTISSIQFDTLVDYGGLYPVSMLKTYTIDRVNDRILAIEDLFAPDTDIAGMLAPYLSEQIDADTLSYLSSDADPSEDLPLYQNFVLTETTLIIKLPPVRMGPMHAGMIDVVIPLAELGNVLILQN